ncbi:MAG: hypothetical protein A2083_04855 [Gemmatimonadetes bacterium GWC2_71_9]|nr:MAG: hypothetical protein A2083_04855 [Gemmatimonadetes bacterium GWC2_71_9]
MRGLGDGAAAAGHNVNALDVPTAALVRVALEIPDGPEAALAAALRAARAAGVSGAWLDELVLAAVLFAGFPRALVAAGLLRRVYPEPAPGQQDAGVYAQWKEWLARGEATCRIIYGANYDQLRRNVAALHPALDRWILVDGYGRTLSRPALDPVRRELCAIAMLIEQDVPRQLHSHYRGALNVGALRAQVEDVLELAARCPSVRADRLAAARSLWADLAAEEH